MEIGGSTKMAYEKNKDKLYINSFCLTAEAAMVAEWWGGGVVGGQCGGHDYPYRRGHLYQSNTMKTVEWEWTMACIFIEKLASPNLCRPQEEREPWGR